MAREERDLYKIDQDSLNGEDSAGENLSGVDLEPASDQELAEEELGNHLGYHNFYGF